MLWPLGVGTVCVYQKQLNLSYGCVLTWVKFGQSNTSCCDVADAAYQTYLPDRREALCRANFSLFLCKLWGSWRGNHNLCVQLLSQQGHNILSITIKSRACPALFVLLAFFCTVCVCSVVVCTEDVQSGSIWSSLWCWLWRKCSGVWHRCGRDGLSSIPPDFFHSRFL